MKQSGLKTQTAKESKEEGFRALHLRGSYKYHPPYGGWGAGTVIEA